MAIDIVVPQMGESIVEATVGNWACKDGDFVEHDQVLVEIETDKAATEIPAPISGILSIKALSGKDVPIGAVLGTIKPANATSMSSKNIPKEKEKIPNPHHEKSNHEKLLAPSAQRVLKQRGLSHDDLPDGTGRGGVILKQDLSSKHISSLGISHRQGQQRIVPMTRLRRTVAERLKHAQEQAVMLSTFNDVNMSKLLDLRNAYRDIFKDKHDVRLGFLSFFVKASISALKEFPIINAFVDGKNILYNDDYHISVAVSTDKGLFTPVVRHGDSLSLAHIERAIAQFAKQAQEGTLPHEDMQGGTFTISNGGVYGSLLSTPVLNPPQSAILGIHRVEERPIARDGKVIIAPMMYLALTYDHRIIDGREAVSFLVRIKQSLEDPQRLFLDV